MCLCVKDCNASIQSPFLQELKYKFLYFTLMVQIRCTHWLLEGIFFHSLITNLWELQNIKNLNSEIKTSKTTNMIPPIYYQETKYYTAIKLFVQFSYLPTRTWNGYHGELLRTTPGLNIYLSKFYCLAHESTTGACKHRLACDLVCPLVPRIYEIGFTCIFTHNKWRKKIF